VAELQQQLGRGVEALSAGRTALERLETVQGRDHPTLIMELSGVGEMLEERGEEQAALEYFQRSLKAAESWPTSGKVAFAKMGMARIHLRHGRVSQARGLIEQALDVQEKENGLMHPELVRPLELLSRVALLQGHVEEAERFALRAEANILRTPESPEYSGPMLVLAQVRLAQSRRAEGLELLREALRRRLLRPQRVMQLAEARFALAKALGPEDSEARALSRQAREAYLAAGANPLRSEVDAFLTYLKGIRIPAP
jgi:eukaryotic-like serine/threonine-protein kinase